MPDDRAADEADCMYASSDQLADHFFASLHDTSGKANFALTKIRKSK